MLKIEILMSELVAAQTNCDEHKDDPSMSAKIMIPMSVTPILPHLHKSYFDEECNTIRPDPCYYKNEKTNVCDANQKIADIQTEQLKLLNDAMKKHGNLWKVGSQSAIKKNRFSMKKQRADITGDSMRDAVDKKKVMFYQQNMQAFGRNPYNHKQRNLNRTESSAMQTVYDRNYLPLHITVCCPLTIKAQANKRNRIPTAPETLFLDWTGMFIIRMSDIVI